VHICGVLFRPYDILPTRIVRQHKFFYSVTSYNSWRCCTNSGLHR